MLEEAPPKAAPAATTAPAEAGAESTKTAPDDEAGKKAPQPRYDSKSFDAWVTNNPDAAAELIAKRFKIGSKGDVDAWKKNFVALEQKRRRHHEANEAELSAARSDREAVTKLRDEALAEIQPHIDAAEALNKEDLAAFDAAFQAAFGKAFEDVSKWRLRARSTGSSLQPVHLAKLTEQDRKIQELEAKLAAKEAPAPAAKKAEEKPAPAVSAKWIDTEVAADHGVRDLADWSKKVEAAYQDSYNEDDSDFDMTIEEAADQVLKEFLDKRKAPAAKDPPRRRAAKPREDDDERTPARDLEEQGGAGGFDFDARLKRALKNAEKRAG